MKTFENSNIVYWTTKSGQKINIDSMSIEHLRNTLKMIVRQTQSYPQQCPHNIEQAYEGHEDTRVYPVEDY